MVKSNVSKGELIKHPLPSAGRIVRGVLPKFDFSKIPKHILENARERGTWVHEAIEEYILTGEYSSRWEWQMYMDAFHEFENEYYPEFLGSEICIVGNDSKGILDTLCMIDDSLYILDFKTSSKASHVPWRLQLMVYARLIDQDVKIGVVQLKKSGEYEFHEYEYDEELIQKIIDVYYYLRNEGIVE